MNNPYSQPYPGNQLSENQRAYGRHRNDRWRTDENVGSRATWRDDNSSRSPNRFGWGEEGGQYGQSRFSSNFSGRYGDYDAEWQSPSNYDDSPNFNNPNFSNAPSYSASQNLNDSRNLQDYRNYENDSRFHQGSAWNQNQENYGGQQEFRLGTPSSNEYRQGISRANQGRDWQSGSGRNYGDSGQLGFRPSWRDHTQSLYGAHTFEGDRMFSDGRGYESLERTYPNTNRDWERGDYQAMSEHRPTGAYGLESNHRGKGPKGYVRSDQRIREELCEILSDDFRVDASDISVEVRDGVVTIEGTVPDRVQKHRVEDIADSRSGVKEVNNALRVTRQASQSPRQGVTNQNSQNLGGQNSKLSEGRSSENRLGEGLGSQNTAFGSSDQSSGKITKQ